MAKQAWSGMSLKVTTTSATAAFQDISQTITEFSGLEIAGETQESHGLGDAWVEHYFAGLKRVSPITLGGFYDDDGTSGVQTIFGNASDIGAERVIKINFGTANAFPKMDVIVKRWSRKPSRGELIAFEVELLPTGAVTVATT